MNPTDPAFPLAASTGDPRDGVYCQNGMDLRTYVAAKVMAAFAGDPTTDSPCEEAARHAVKWADALIDELNRTKQ